MTKMTSERDNIALYIERKLIIMKNLVLFAIVAAIIEQCIFGFSLTKTILEAVIIYGIDKFSSEGE